MFPYRKEKKYSLLTSNCRGYTIGKYINSMYYIVFFKLKWKYVRVKSLKIWRLYTKINLNLKLYNCEKADINNQEEYYKLLKKTNWYMFMLEVWEVEHDGQRVWLRVQSKAKHN